MRVSTQHAYSGVAICGDPIGPEGPVGQRPNGPNVLNHTKCSRTCL